MPSISRPLIFTRPLIFPRNQTFVWGRGEQHYAYISNQEAGLQDETYQNIQGRNLRTHQMMGPFSFSLIASRDSPF